MVILAIISAISATIWAFFVGSYNNLIITILAWLLSFFGGIIGFKIGKYLKDWVGEYSIFTSGSFWNLVFEKFNALYGPMISGFLIGNFLPAMLFLIFGGKDLQSLNTLTNSKAGKIVEKSLADQKGISKYAEKYILPLIEEDEKLISNYGKIVKKTEETKDSKIIVQWKLENNEFLKYLKSNITTGLIPLNSLRLLNIDKKIFIPMNFFNKLKYESFDESVNNYIEKDVYRDILNYINKGYSREHIPYDSEVVNWYKYFSCYDGKIHEKTDYAHWYFDNNKQGTEEDYNNYKNKYSFYHTFEGYFISDAETIKQVRNRGILPGTENKVTINDINYFNETMQEIVSNNRLSSLEYDNLGYLKNAINNYNIDFNDFIVKNWKNYPDTMKIHLEFEKQSKISDFSEYLKEKLKLFNIKEKGIISLFSRVTEEKYQFTDHYHYTYTEYELFNESVEAFEKEQPLKNYFNEQKKLIIQSYYDSEEFKERLKLFNELIKFDDSEIYVICNYTVEHDYVSDKIKAYRRGTEPILTVEIKTPKGWQTAKLNLSLLNSNSISSSEFDDIKTDFFSNEDWNLRISPEKISQEEFLKYWEELL